MDVDIGVSNVNGSHLGSAAAVSTSTMAIGWEYELSKGKWVRYDKETTAKLNMANGVKTLELELDESKLSIDLHSMKQRNLTTGFVRSIRCIVIDSNDRFAWEYIDAKRRWRAFNSDVILKLEEAFKGGLGSMKVDFDGQTFNVDFESKIVKSSDGSLQYKIRREVSNAEAAVVAKPTPSVDRIRSLRKRQSEKKAGQNGLQAVENDSIEDALPLKKQKKQKANGDSEAATVKEEGPEQKPEICKVLVKGAAAVDPECVEKVHVAHVYTEGKDIFDALLNQTNTQNNNNKYYIIQLLEEDNKKSYSVWFRWGRVGYKGQRDLIPCGSDLERAKTLFCRKFTDKTKNEWSERKKFRKVAGKYDFIPADYSKINAENKVEKKKKKPTLKGPSIEAAIQNLLNLICDLRLMEENVMELEYDAAKTPLGKLTEKQIKTGYSLLKKIENHIKKMDFSRQFVETVNDYYTKIPHSFGMRQPPLIKTIEQLKTESTLLEMLSNIEIGIRTIGKGEEDSDLHPLDRQYANMKCALTTVSPDDARYEFVQKYLQNTHAPTHSLYRMKIKYLFAVDRCGETDAFLRHIGNRKLLWHGSRMTNWYGILSQGLRIAPPEAPMTGYMFGKGIYFADMSSKSANYCFPQRNKPGVLLLAEVALGEPRMLLKEDYNAHKLPDGKHSTIGLGKIGPDPAHDESTEDGCIVPIGKPIELAENKLKKCTLNYNEYVVYKTEQVRIRYILVLDFIFDS